MDTNYEALKDVMNKLNENFDKTNIQNEKHINNVLDYISVIEEIGKVISPSKTKDVLMEAQSDLLHSLIFSCQGYYRYAYVCLRSSIELLLSFLYYYDNRYDFALWQNDYIDMTWTQLSNSETGVFNNKFLSIINDCTINTERLLCKFKNLYHITSQYVHGKYDYMQKNLNDRIDYSEELVNQYFNIYIEILKIEISMLYIRFKKEIDEFMDQESVMKISVLLNRYEVFKNE